MRIRVGASEGPKIAAFDRFSECGGDQFAWGWLGVIGVECPHFDFVFS